MGVKAFELSTWLVAFIGFQHNLPYMYLLYFYVIYPTNPTNSVLVACSLLRKIIVLGKVDIMG